MRGEGRTYIRVCTFLLERLLCERVARREWPAQRRALGHQRSPGESCTTTTSPRQYLDARKQVTAGLPPRLLPRHHSSHFLFKLIKEMESRGGRRRR